MVIYYFILLGIRHSEKKKRRHSSEVKKKKSKSSKTKTSREKVKGIMCGRLYMYMSEYRIFWSHACKDGPSIVFVVIINEWLKHTSASFLYYCSNDYMYMYIWQVCPLTRCSFCSLLKIVTLFIAAIIN